MATAKKVKKNARVEGNELRSEEDVEAFLRHLAQYGRDDVAIRAVSALAQLKRPSSTEMTDWRKLPEEELERHIREVVIPALEKKAVDVRLVD